MKIIFSYFIFFLLLYKTSAKDSVNDFKNNYSEYNENIYRKYVKIDKAFKNVAEKSVKWMLPYLLEAREQINISTKCANNLFDLINGFRKLTNWSINFLDATGKLQSGIQTGNIQMFGEYDECVNTVVRKKGRVDFEGQFCQVVFKPLLPKTESKPSITDRLEGLINATKNSSDIMKTFVSKVQVFYTFDVILGICVPSGCSKGEVSEILKYFLEDYLNISIRHCLKKEDLYFWTTRRIIIVCILAVFGVIVIISTSIDRVLESRKKNESGFKLKILQCFSLIRNFPKLMHTGVSENSITCLHGTRVLTIFWIILSHEYFLHTFALTANHSANYEGKPTNFFAQIILNGFLSVDIFFFISGFVNCYSRMLIKNEGKSQPGFFQIIIHRLWRMYPAFIIALLLSDLLNDNRPNHYHFQVDYAEKCDLYWWRNFLFISNFFSPSKMCLAQSWFISTDMQLFLLALCTIPVLLSKPKPGIILHVLLIMVANFSSMTWWLTDDLSPGTVDTKKFSVSDFEKTSQIYILPVLHIGPYFIGILLGYVLATTKKIKIPKIIQFIGWFAASLLFLSMLFMTLKWNSGIPYTKLESALYGAWSKTLFVLGFSWLVLCSATGYGGLINYILSLKLWVPLSRITYMLYLVSPLVQTHFFFHLNFPEDYSDMRILWTYFANLSVSILMSIVLVLIAESPIIAIEKILFQRYRIEDSRESAAPKKLTINNATENRFQGNEKITTIQI